MLTDLKGFKINLNGRQWMPHWGRSQLAFDTCITASWKSHKKGRLEPWVRKIPWRRAWQPTPVFLPGESPWTEEPGGLQSTWSQSWTWLKQISTHARKRDAERSARYVGRSPSFVNLLKLSKDNLYLLMQGGLKINLNSVPELFSAWAVIRGDLLLIVMQGSDNKSFLSGCYLSKSSSVRLLPRWALVTSLSWQLILPWTQMTKEGLL